MAGMLGLVVLSVLIQGLNADDILLYSNLPTVKATLNGDPSFITNDLLARNEWVNLTYETEWCSYHKSFNEFCGSEPGAIYAYCIYMKEWPMPEEELSAWMNITVFASSLTYWPQVSAVCACAGNGSRAVWIPEDPAVGFTYDSGCHAEWAFFSLIIVIIVAYAVLLIISLLEVTMWVAYFVSGRNKVDLVSTFLPKIFVVLAVCCFIAFEVSTIQPDYRKGPASPGILFGIAWTGVFGFIFATLAIIWWLFTFVRVTTKIRDFTSKVHPLWDAGFVFFAICISLLCLWMIIGTGIVYNLTRYKLPATKDFLEKQTIGADIQRYSNSVNICALVGIALDSIWSGVLTLKSAYDFSKAAGFEMDFLVKEKCIWNGLMTIFTWLTLFTWCTYFPIRGAYLSIFEYTAFEGQQWLSLLLVVFCWFALFSITMALRTRFEGGYFSGLFRGTVTSVSVAGRSNGTRGTNGTRGEVTN